MENDFIEKLKKGGIGILPTDTLYGLVGSAFSKKAVDKIYKLKKRNPKKSSIILVSSFRDLELFDIKITKDVKKILNKYWPGKVSIVFPYNNINGEYHSDGTKSLAFRMPKDKKLLAILKKTGPLIAPSANPDGKKPAETIAEAKKYFGSSLTIFWNKKLNKYISDNNYEHSRAKINTSKMVRDKIDFYVDGGKLKSLPSTLIKIQDGRIQILREGAVKIKSTKHKIQITNKAQK